MLVEEINSDLKAYDVFCLLRHLPSVAFLESMPGYGVLGRHSILGFNPYLTLRGWQEHCRQNGQIVQDNPFKVLNRLLQEFQTPPIDGLPIVGGCIGTIAYDAGFSLNDLPLPARSAAMADQSNPLVSFDFFDNFLIFNHQTGKIHAVACGQLESEHGSLERIRQLLAPPPLASPASNLMAKAPGSPDLIWPEKTGYLAKVEAIRESISQGEVYIVNLTDQIEARIDETAETLYDRMREINPAPFAAFVRQNGREILSASPERLLAIRLETEKPFLDAPKSKARIARRIETRPIKGTRPRGRHAAEDEKNAAALLNSEKDRAELLMIVDLERNDLSKICRPESVKVPELFALETYPSVFHLVATVTGILKDEISAVDSLCACFPGGSISGAPKVAAMKTIDRLERQPRGLYTGCLGYFSFDGQADFNILIRSMVRQGQIVRYGSGGGITWESDAVEEYLEMLVKAESFAQTINREETGNAMD